MADDFPVEQLTAVLPLFRHRGVQLVSGVTGGRSDLLVGGAAARLPLVHGPDSVEAPYVGPRSVTTNLEFQKQNGP